MLYTDNKKKLLLNLKTENIFYYHQYYSTSFNLYY